MQNKT
jgi:hypothetical protein